MRVLAVIGTRPEAIKMAPVMTALAAAGGIAARLCLTGQHRDLPAPVLALFGVAVDAALAPMPPGCGPAGVAGHVLAGLPRVLAALRPDLVLVHGDTTTALAAALAAHYGGIAVGHVEAGLRTGDLAAPWPEEANRRMVAALAALHFAPTGAARANLLAENVAAAAIHVTGNTVIDALYRAVAIVAGDPARGRDGGRSGATKRTILVTAHRREAIGEGIGRICAALVRLAARGDVAIVYPLHPNPAIGGPVRARLAGVAGIRLLPAQDYAAFVGLMARADLILTDSGGIQEEAPALGVPVLVMRDTTERPEAIAAGTARLVGTTTDGIVAGAAALLDDPAAYSAMVSATNPYGDGQAAPRIVEIIRKWGKIA